MKTKTILYVSLLSVLLGACETLQPIDTIAGGNEDEFFVRVSDIVAKDTAHDYTRIRGESLTPYLLSQIRKTALKTEGTYGIGQMYQMPLSEPGTGGQPEASYMLFLMDSVVTNPQALTTPGGKQINVELGAKAIKWAVYQLKPVPPSVAPQEGLQ